MSGLRWYVCDYDWHGKTHAVHIEAHSEKDARARLRRLPMARIMGTLETEVTVPGGNLIGRLIRKLKGGRS